MARNESLLLTDEQMREFITNGFLILKTDFSKEFHEQLVHQLNEVYEKEGNPGNNLLPRIRELHQVFDHPVVNGALTSVLGPKYMLHAHRHGHYNAAKTAGNWHKDSYWGYKRMRNHHPWWAMIMYFPQDTPLELGPTGLMPGTQNYETRTFASDETDEEALASGDAGTFALIHYDIWHRSTPNILNQARYMLKFEFMRTHIPSEPSWDHQEPLWVKPAALNPHIAEHELIWEETWNWLSGKVGSIADTLPGDQKRIQVLSQQLKEEDEPIALNAVYELACRGKQGIEVLAAALRDENLSISRRAAYGLSISGTPAVHGLISVLEDQRSEIVCHAVFALGELRHLASDAMSNLILLLDHPDALVRRAVVEALGSIRTPVQDAVAGLIRGLQDEDIQTRFMTGLSITRLGIAAKDTVSYLEKALDDENRYVRAHAAEALRYIGTEQAKDVLIKDLFDTRWCSTTTKANSFYP